jgi:hypothetical protein
MRTPRGQVAEWKCPEGIQGLYVWLVMADRAQYLTVCEVEVLQEKIDIPMRADPITQHASRPGMDNFPRDKITVEMWIKTRGQGDGIVSYATPEEPNMFLISNQEAIV